VDVEKEFLFLLHKDLGCCLDKFPFLTFPQTCARSVLLGSSRFPMLSVDDDCEFAFSLRERERYRERERERETLDTERDRETERETRH
jgi:hypothetical protein